MRYLERDAVISSCGKYRYLLRRVWDFVKPRMLYVMINPSTGNAEDDDATIRSCVRLANALGYGSIEVVNLFAWRSTDPDVLGSLEDPEGPRNSDIVAAAIGRCDVVVCAWGAFQIARITAQEMVSEIRSHRPAAYCFGKNKNGTPKHPLYIKTGTQLQTYDVSSNEV